MFIFFLFIHFIAAYGGSSFVRQFASDIEITSTMYDIGNRPTSLSQSGYSITVWSVQSKDDTNFGIMGQIYDGKGNSYGGKFKISTTVEYLLNYPSVAMQNDGYSLVVWQSQGQDGDGFGIYGQFLSMNQKIGTEFAINKRTQGNQMFPTVTAADLYYIVTWQGPDSDGNGIYAKVYNYYGQAVVPEFLVNQNETNDQTNPSVASTIIDPSYTLNTVVFVVTWMSYGAVSDYANGIYAEEFIFVAGKKGLYYFEHGDEFVVNKTSEKNPTFPRIAMSLNRTNVSEALYVIVWQSDQVKASIFSMLNGPIIQDMQVNTRKNKDPNLQFLPSVGMSNVYGFIVTYQMKAYDSIELDIYSQIFDLSWKRSDNERKINVYQNYDQKFPFVRINGNNQIIYTWISKNFDNTGNAVNFQFFSQKIGQFVLGFDGNQTNFPFFNISKILPFVFKIDVYNKYDWILVKDGNIKVNVYDAVLKSFISAFEIANSSNYEEFDIDFGSSNNQNYYILVFRNGSDIYLQSNAFSQIIKINKKYSARKPQIYVLSNNSFAVIYTCYLTNLGSSICIRTFDPNFQGYDEIFISDSFLSSNVNADDASFYVVQKNLEDVPYITIVWALSNANLTKIQGVMIVIKNMTVFESTNTYDVYQIQNFKAIPKVAMGKSLQSFVIWEEISVKNNTEVLIKGQVITMDGFKCSPLIEISSFSDLQQLNPSISAIGETFFVVWSSFGQDTDGFGILGQNFDYYGNKQDNVIFINNETLGDQLYPILVNRKFQSEYDIFWTNSKDLSLSSQSFISVEVISLDVTPFLTNNYLGDIMIHQFGQKLDVSEAIFTKDGKYFLAGLINGAVQIYDFGSLFILKELKLSNSTFSKMIMLDNSAIILDNLCQKMFIVNLSNIFDPTLETFSFIETCIIDVTKVNNFLFDVFNSILYFGYNQKICLYNLTNPKNGTYDLLKQYEIQSNNDLQSVYLHNSSLFCLYSNGTANIIETGSLSDFRLIANQNFGSDIIEIFWRPDGKRLYLSRNISFEIYENHNLTFVLLTSKLQYHPFQFSISNDRQLLSFIRKNGNNWEYVILDISNDNYNVVIQIYSYIPKQGPYSSMFHPNSQFLLLCETQGMEIVKLVKENSTNETPTLSSSKNSNYYHNFSNWWIDISPSQQTVYMMNRNQQIVSVNVNDFEGNSFYFSNISRFFIFPYNSTSADEKIMIYEVVNETNFQLQSEIKYKNINDYLVSSEEKIIYVVVSNKIDNITFLSLDISDKKKPNLLVQKDLGFVGSPHLEFSFNETEIFVSIDQIGLVILNISNPRNVEVIKVIPNSKHNFSIFITSRISGNDYLIVSDPKKLVFVVYQVNYNDFTLKTMGSSSTTQEIMGFQVFNGIYLLVQLANYQIILYSLYDIFNPKQISSFVQFSLDEQITRIKMVISSVTSSCYLPFGDESILLFPKQNNSLYADIYLIPNSQQIEFNIEFFPLNLDPNTKIKLLQIIPSNGNSKLLTSILDHYILKIYPNNIQDIVDLLQPLSVVYSTNINREELSENEINTLIYSNYIDNNLFLKDIDISAGVSLFDPTISTARINFVLSQHYFTKIMYLPIEIFQSSTLPILNNLTISAQIGNNIFLADDLIDFTLSQLTFVNIYEFSVLSYTAENLPSWLNFDSHTLRFYGISSFNDLDKNYTITVTASNGFHEATDSFEIKIRYYKPFLKIPLQQQITSNPSAEEETTYFFFKDSFIDPNNGSLFYEVRMTNYEPLPIWLVFDESNLAFKLNPSDQNHWTTYRLNVTARNKFFNCSDVFSFYVFPSNSYILTLISQILGGILAVIGYFKYKSDVYNILCKKYYVFPPQEIICDNFYEKEIYFINSDLKKAWNLWINLLKETSFNNFNENILLQKDFKINFSNELKLANNKFILKNPIKKTDEIDNVLLDVDNTIFTVCECFLYHHLMKSNKSLHKFYNDNFNSIKKKDHTKEWYLDYVSFSNEYRDRSIQKFKKVLINYDNIKARLESVPNLLNENNPSFHLICGMIKADALGIPSNRRLYQNLEYCRGESCFLDISDIKQISFKIYSEANKYVEIGINNIKHLPSWFDFQTKNGILILQGKPDYYEKGMYNVTLIARNNFNIRWQDIKVETKKLEVLEKVEFEKNGKEKENKFDAKESIKLDIPEDKFKINEIK